MCQQRVEADLKYELQSPGIIGFIALGLAGGLAVHAAPTID